MLITCCIYQKEKGLDLFFLEKGLECCLCNFVE